MQKMHNTHQRIVIQLPKTCCTVQSTFPRSRGAGGTVSNGSERSNEVHTTFAFFAWSASLQSSSSIPRLNQLRPVLQGIGKKTAWKTILEENRLQLQVSKFYGDSVLSESTLRSGEELLCT